MYYSLLTELPVHNFITITTFNYASCGTLQYFITCIYYYNCYNIIVTMIQKLTLLFFNIVELSCRPLISA